MKPCLLSWKSNYIRVNDFCIIGRFLQSIDSPNKIQHHLCNHRKLSNQLALPDPYIFLRDSVCCKVESHETTSVAAVL